MRVESGIEVIRHSGMSLQGRRIIMEEAPSMEPIRQEAQIEAFSQTIMNEGGMRMRDKAASDRTP